MATERVLPTQEMPHSVSRARRIGRRVVDVFAPTPISAYFREHRGAYPRVDYTDQRLFVWVMGTLAQGGSAIFGGGIAASGSVRDGVIFGSVGYAAGKVIEFGNQIYERKVRETS